MKVQVASSLLAAPLLPTPALSSSVELAAPSSTNNGKAHRLLQRFKDKHAANTNRQLASSDPDSDVGILTTPRFLEDNYEYYCPRDTCPSELCDCADQGGSLEDCTTELQNVCLQGKLSDCVYEGYIAVYQTVYCPFVSCLGEGFRQNQCDCAFYDLYCARLETNECKNVVPDTDGGSDKKPFFGCDETELASVCDQAKACKDAGDLNGLPDLGSWVGTSTVGLKSSSGVRVGAFGVAAAGAVVLSSLVMGLNL